MLLDDALLIVARVSTDNKTVLRLLLTAISRKMRSLSIDVILLLVILYEPAVILELLELTCSLSINLWVILGSTWLKVNLWFDDMVE